MLLVLALVLALGLLGLVLVLGLVFAVALVFVLVLMLVFVLVVDVGVETPPPCLDLSSRSDMSTSSEATEERGEPGESAIGNLGGYVVERWVGYGDDWEGADLRWNWIDVMLASGVGLGWDRGRTTEYTRAGT